MHTNFNGASLPTGDHSTSRREFLQTASLGLGSLMLGGVPGATGKILRGRGGKSVIFVYLAGGPSHLDMYDMKPDAPAEIRGEFRPINTNVPGIRVCELLPLHAKIADKFSIVNGVETIDTHSPAVVTTGFEARYEKSGLREMDSVRVQTPEFPQGNWDTHGRVLGRKLTIFEELREKLPVYDQFMHALITGIHDRGMQSDVLVVACGEFGRTPWINKYGGRDHWAPCGSVLIAGGNLRMGTVIGDTGPIGEREQKRSQPYTAQNVLATIYLHLGIDPRLLLDNPYMIDGLNMWGC